MPETTIEKKGWGCLRCNHKWEQKEGFDPENKPITCPNCRSPYWDIERKVKND